jgi:hypothetical protein
MSVSYIMHNKCNMFAYSSLFMIHLSNMSITYPLCVVVPTYILTITLFIIHLTHLTRMSLNMPLHRIADNVLPNRNDLCHRDLHEAK